MTAQHRLDLFEEGSLLAARVVCLGGPEDECQQWCAEGCEEECYHTPILWPTVKPPSPMAPIDGHQYMPSGSCRFADWLNADDLYDACQDPDDDLFEWDEETDSQPRLRSGLIDVEWDGETYLWQYAEEVAAR